MNIQNKPWMSEEETNLILSFINKNETNLMKQFIVLTIILILGIQPSHFAQIPEWAKGVVWYQIFPERFEKDLLPDHEGYYYLYPIQN